MEEVEIFFGMVIVRVKRERAEENIEEILYQKIKRNFHTLQALSATINLAARQTAHQIYIEELMIPHAQKAQSALSSFKRTFRF